MKMKNILNIATVAAIISATLMLIVSCRGFRADDMLIIKPEFAEDYMVKDIQDGRAVRGAIEKIVIDEDTVVYFKMKGTGEKIRIPYEQIELIPSLPDLFTIQDNTFIGTEYQNILRVPSLKYFDVRYLGGSIDNVIPDNVKVQVTIYPCDHVIDIKSTEEEDKSIKDDDKNQNTINGATENDTPDNSDR